MTLPLWREIEVRELRNAWLGRLRMASLKEGVIEDESYNRSTAALLQAGIERSIMSKIEDEATMHS